MAWRAGLRSQLLLVLFFAALTTVCAEAVAEYKLGDFSRESVEEQIQVCNSIPSSATLADMMLGMLLRQSTC